MREHEEPFEVSENQLEKKYTTTLLAEHGLGFGDKEHGISVEKQMLSGELNQESLHEAIELVMHDAEVFVPVDAEANDDGCGDGRNTIKIYRLLDPLTGKVETYKRSLRRAKLFGGGLIASASMWRAVSGAPHHGETLKGDREFMADELRDRNVRYGAHTDEHASGEKCGCGAIDRYGEISRNVVALWASIEKTLHVVYGEDYDNNVEAIEHVFTMYKTLGDTYQAGVTGKETMDFIEKDGAIVKQLEGSHKEAMVVLNNVAGTTLDQDKLRKKLAQKDLSPGIQAFVVDVWRGRMYAELVADIAVSTGIDKETAYRRAFADFLIRTLAVSATLTAGDQAVIVREEQKDFALAV